MTRSKATKATHAVGVRQRRSRAQLAAVLVLLVFGAAPLAFAQTTPKKPKKGAKPAASASASATAEPAPEPPAPPPPPPEPPPAVAVSVEASEAPAEGEPSPNEMTYTKEDPAKKYYFVGLRYRGTVIPKFLLNLFVNDGATIFSNTIGAELDMRQDSKSLIPWIAYTSYSTGDMLFLQKGKDPTDPDQYSVVNSGLGAIYLGIDELWSMPIANHLDFEYGFGAHSSPPRACTTASASRTGMARPESAASRRGTRTPPPTRSPAMSSRTGSRADRSRSSSRTSLSRS
jgi:hypothetical protein